MIVIAHRGASAYAPEHTFAAYDLALTMGADYIEQDLQMTADGELVVLHDDTLERTSRGGLACAGPVIERTLAEIRSCDVGSWFNERHAARARPEYAAQRIPTLDEVFTRYAGRARFYIETKNPEAAPGMEEALLALLERHHLRMTGAPRWNPPPPVVIQSFSMASLRKLRTLGPDLPLVWLVDSDADSRSIITALDEVAGFANGIGPHRSSVDGALVAAAHARDLVVHPYTVNDETHMRALIDVGVDGMFTDAPDRLKELLKR